MDSLLHKYICCVCKGRVAVGAPNMCQGETREIRGFKKNLSQYR